MTLCDTTICTGCGACVNACVSNCISMKENEAGFLYPSIDSERCVDCGLCRKSCPQLSDKPLKEHIEIFSATYKGEDALIHSSSGGAAYAFSKKVLEEGGVVFGAAYGDDFYVSHIEVQDMAQLPRLQGSKYVQSDIQLCYRQVKKRLAEKRKVLFIGTPCQVGGLLSYLGNTDTQNLITCDLLCGGVPSPKVFQKYIRFLTKKHGTMSGFNFRSKQYGYGYLNISLTTNNKEYCVSGSDAQFVKCIGKGYVRESCFHCDYASLERIGDITIGDFWNLSIDKETWEKGVSAVVIHSDKGRQFFETVQQEFLLAARSLETFKKTNTCALSAKKKKPKDYDAFFADCSALPWTAVCKKHLYTSGIKGKINDYVPAFLLTYIRKAWKK